jgi:hypothetical protein
MVYRFDALLVFPNAAFFAERLEALVAGVSRGLNDVSSHRRCLLGAIWTSQDSFVWSPEGTGAAVGCPEVAT